MWSCRFKEKRCYANLNGTAEIFITWTLEFPQQITTISHSYVHIIMRFLNILHIRERMCVRLFHAFLPHGMSTLKMCKYSITELGVGSVIRDAIKFAYDGSASWLGRRCLAVIQFVLLPSVIFKRAVKITATVPVSYAVFQSFYVFCESVIFGIAFVFGRKRKQEEIPNKSSLKLTHALIHRVLLTESTCSSD